MSTVCSRTIFISRVLGLSFKFEVIWVRGSVSILMELIVRIPVFTVFHSVTGKRLGEFYANPAARGELHREGSIFSWINIYPVLWGGGIGAHRLEQILDYPLIKDSLLEFPGTFSRNCARGCKHPACHIYVQIKHTVHTDSSR